MKITVCTDIFDPSKGSEFQTAQKAIKASCEAGDEAVELWTTVRAQNAAAIGRWLKEHGLSDRVHVNLVHMHLADEFGNHPTRLHFALDLLRLWRRCLHASSDRDTILWKCGQLNFVFNLPFLFLRRRMILGPITGYEYPPLRWIVASRQWQLAIKYIFYSALIASGRVLTRLAMAIPRRRRMDLLVCTSNDYEAIAGKAGKLGPLVTLHRVVEADLENILDRTTLSSERCQEDSVPSVELRRPFILWAGHFISRKNPQLAAEALLALLCRRPMFRAFMIGDGPLFDRVAAQVKHAPAGADRLQVRRGLPRSEFMGLLGRADALLVTSWREANSVLIFEALAADVPVLSPHVSGMKEVVPHGGTTYLLEASLDPKAIGFALDQMLSTDRKANGRSYVRQLQEREQAVVQLILSRA